MNGDHLPRVTHDEQRKRVLSVAHFLSLHVAIYPLHTTCHPFQGLNYALGFLRSLSASLRFGRDFVARVLRILIQERLGVQT